MANGIKFKSFPFDDELNLSKVLEIDRDAFGKEDCWSRDNFLFHILGKKELSLVVLMDDITVGYIIGTYYFDSTNILIVHLNRIALKKTLRGKNFGRFMLESFELSANNLGAKAITLECLNQSKLLSFYEGNGFKRMNSDKIKNYLLLKDKLNRLSDFLNHKTFVLEKVL
jgi:ribosomal protein S18 acetylase RimI-like enzyme